MNESGIATISEQEAIEQIVKTVKRADKGTAPFALVLGSGFSHGLVPTTKEIVEESLPLWLESRNKGKPFEELKQAPPGERSAIAKEFWKSFLDSNRKRGCNLELGPATGLPTDASAAYKAAFTSKYFDAVGEPAEARKLQRALMRLDQARLNAAHFLLASLLGVQPGKNRPSKLFKTLAAFSRLILTTNFDPFLQTALQAVNRLYFMSDTPDLGISDEISDDQTDAIHLVYMHGSIHRRSQAASDEDIIKLKQKNARTLAPVLKRHGVIVLGYSGWDDTIVEALAACDRFDHRLYWCGRQTDPLAKGAFGEKVPDILRKPAAQYVKIGTAGSFMAQLCNGLVEGLPRLLSNPIGQLRELLAAIDLTELDFKSKDPVSIGSNSLQFSDSGTPSQDFHQVKKSTLQRLEDAEQLFLGQVSLASAEQKSVNTAGKTPTAEEAAHVHVQRPASPGAAVKAQQLLASARLARSLGNHQEALKLCEEALSLSPLDASIKIELCLFQGLGHYLLGQMENAMACWSRVIDMPGAPIVQIARALHNRGVAWGQKGETDKALADFTRVIEGLPDAPVEQVAKALNNRGVAWGQKGETKQELADYARVIGDLPGVPVAQVAEALYNRGVTWGQKGETEKALADFTLIIDGLPGAPVAHVAKALNNRGVAWGQKGETDNELADYTRVIEGLPGTPVEQVAEALYNRGVTWWQKGETDKALADYTRVIEGLPGAPVEQIANALNNRGVAWCQKGETGKALADYTRVVENLSGAPIEQVAKALINRGVTWGQKGETDRALADYTRVIEALPGAPPEQVAVALINRGVAWGQKGETEKALVDFTRLIEGLSGAPVEQVATALINRGVAWGQKGETEKALGDFARVIEGLPCAPVEQVAKALINRGVAWGQKGETDHELADYTRVIEGLPCAPVEQVAKALINRGVAWGQIGETDNELADYTRVIEGLPGAPVEQVAKAINNRGVAWGQKGETDKALIEYTRVIESLPGAPVEQVAKALNNRGVTWGQKGEIDEALLDFTRVIESLRGAPVEQVAKALHSRGVAWGQKGETDKALVDYTRLIEGLPYAPVEQVARALHDRGVAWGQKGETDKALADYTWMIEGLPGAPVEHVSRALANRGWANYRAQRYAQFLADTEAALNKQPWLEAACFNLGLALLAVGRDAEALDAYRRAGEAFPNSIQNHGLDDLVEAQKTWLSNERAMPVNQLLTGLLKR